MNLEEYKKAFPYICNSCGELSHTFYEYCRKCGRKGSLRKAYNSDYEDYEIKRTALKSSTISLSDITLGLILSIIGGLSSIALAFWLELIVPNLAMGLGGSFIIIRAITLIGGGITLFGIVIVLFNMKVGSFIILISGIIAGGNILTIIGAILIFRKIKRY